MDKLVKYYSATAKTEGESVFKEFCALNTITCEKIQEGEDPTPDYKVILTDQVVLFEVKQIDEDDNFNADSSSRTVGSHIRKKIEQARKQAQAASNASAPFVLLVYNNLDRVQTFGTEQYDFIDAMYGERTLVFDKSQNAITDSFQGQNRSLGDEKNTSFSAVGNLRRTHRGIEVRIYENIFAKHKLDFSLLPACIEATRIEFDKSHA